jgi:alkaline phosphatase
MTNTSNHVQSIAQWAQVKGKSTGLVTTARVTHASPAGVFGHSAQREWETDTDIINAKQDPEVCTDLATQLVTEEVGKNLNVIMGGGRYAFLPSGTKGEEEDDGYRSDGVNLIEKWKTLKEGEKAQYIWNREQLLGLEDTDYVLGKFSKQWSWKGVIWVFQVCSKATTARLI